MTLCTTWTNILWSLHLLQESITTENQWCLGLDYWENTVICMAFHNFLEACTVKPGAIVTHQDRAMTNAINQVFDKRQLSVLYVALFEEGIGEDGCCDSFKWWFPRSISTCAWILDTLEDFQAKGEAQLGALSWGG